MAAVEGSGGAEGIVLPMTMSGDGYAEAIYSVPVTTSSGSTFKMLIDAGSSDTWLASTSCQSTPCQRAGTPLYGWSPTTIDSETTYEFNYLVGRVQGNVVWDTFRLGTYTLANQTLLSAAEVENERLSSEFVGLIGLSQEYNSHLATHFEDQLQLPTTTLPTKLFSSPNAPTSRTIGITLSRPGQSNSGTPSLLSIGRHPSSVVRDPSKINYSSVSGATYWKLPVTDITIWTVGDYDKGTGAYGSREPTSLALGSSTKDPSSIWPVAVLDTGGAHIVTTRHLANMFWGSYGVGPASDGMYYVPCRTPINITIEMGNVHYAIHPLDMSYVPMGDPYSGMCVGSLQASDQLFASDIVLGAAFMRNVYTVLQYDTPRAGVAQGAYDPATARAQVGLMRLTSWQKGLDDFYRVRVLGEPLDDPSSSSSGSNSGSTGGGSSNRPGDPFSKNETTKKMSVGIMALIGVMAFFGVAAFLFGLRWWMMKRRWARLRAATVAQDTDAEKDVMGEEGAPRPSRLDKDEAYERAHSAAYNRESVVWDADSGTVVGKRTSRVGGGKNRKPGKTHSFAGSRVGLMGEWVEPDSDEEEGPSVRASTGAASAATNANTSDRLAVRESWATVKPREVGELDVLERANRTMSVAGVGAGGGIQFVGGSVDFGRPVSMPVDISQVAASPGGILGITGPGMQHRPTYSRDDSADGGVGMPLLANGSRSPLGQTTFSPGDLIIPGHGRSGSVPIINELSTARTSVDVGLGKEHTPPARPGIYVPGSRLTAGDSIPVDRGSMDIASPTSHWGREAR